jgi:hypothetical protein
MQDGIKIKIKYITIIIFLVATKKNIYILFYNNKSQISL